jgi:hypothetical protein
VNNHASRDAAADPIVVPNSLWTVADPVAYSGGLPSEITHLAEFEASGLGRRDDARWSGPLEVIPAKADVILDLIRVNSLWPLLSGLACCAIEMISAATSKNDMDRFGWFPFRASPRQADVLIVAARARQRWPARSSDSGSRCRSRSGASPWVTAPARVGATSGATRQSRASIESCRSTSTFPDARRARKLSSTRS